MKKSAFVILIILALSLISASVSVGKQSHDIITSYSLGSELSGWVNISLSNEPRNSIFMGSEGGQISLIELLSLPENSAFNFECNPPSCDSAFSLSTLEEEKMLSLREDEVAFIGFKITDTNPITSVSEFNFTLSSTNPESEKFPLAIDLLNDGIMEWEAYQSSLNYQEENDGCFLAVGIQRTEISESADRYCEKVELTRAPEVEIGAYIYKETPASANFELSIEKADGSDFMEQCLVTTSGTGVRRVACIPEYQVKEDGDYFVCINAETGGDEGQIDYEINSPKCGFGGDYFGIYTTDFNIFARLKNYESNIDIGFNDTEIAEYGSDTTDLSEYVYDYLGMYENSQG